MHPAPWIPASQYHVCVIHQAVKAGNIPGLTTEKKDWKLQQADKPRMLKIFPDIRMKRAEQVKPERPPDNPHVEKFSDREGRLVHHFLHSCLVFILCLTQKKAKLLTAPRLHTFKEIIDTFLFRRKVGDFVLS